MKLEVPEKNIKIEVGSPVENIMDRPIFYHLIDNELTENDFLFFTKMNGCSRNNLEFLKLQEKLHKKSVTLISLDLTYSNDRVLINYILYSRLVNKPIK